MQIILTLLYALAMGLSAWGVVGPLCKARRFAAKAGRAKAAIRALEREKYSDDEHTREKALARLRSAATELFEGGPETLEQMGRSWIFHGGSTERDALAEAKSRMDGLPWVVAGVCVGSVASILALWTL
ncbi:hypothetical protein [Brachybacterium paraconglomeratum]|uniref:hypothetical protein n=1 Tax=Brachybacterium paraconglomeratum TaxID=173362 RepID=UPI0021A37225|nr:hypothetical protein [Brachybacterium paraconglomeratum]MCT1909661.1 hypothetical protein [Brachybacterium paraconglomeratum]